MKGLAVLAKTCDLSSTTLVNILLLHGRMFPDLCDRRLPVRHSQDDTRIVCGWKFSMLAIDLLSTSASNCKILQLLEKGTIMVSPGLITRRLAHYDYERSKCTVNVGSSPGLYY